MSTTADEPGANGGKRTQRERRAASRAAILSAAREEFLEAGYQGVSLESIAARAGLTRGAVYHQFKDKSAVMAEVVSAEAERVRGVIGASMEAVAHPIERLRVGCALYLDMITDVRIMRLIHVDYPQVCGPERWTLESPWLADVEEMLREAVDRGLLKDVPIRATARLVLAFIREMVVAFVFASDRRAVRNEMMAALGMLLDGVSTRGADAATG